MKKIIAASLVAFSFATFAAPAFAATQAPAGEVGSNNPNQNDTSGSAPNGSNFQLISCNPTFNPATGQLDHDCNFAQLVATAYRFIVYIFYIMIPILAAMIIITGYKYMTAGGDANLVADAKRMLRPVIIGIFLIIGAWLIVHTILDKLLAPSVGSLSKEQIIGK
ncbi:MAG TPA: pilin [Candidatus Paceibacterota bacterium]|nr:pilin [Candidatus Paceibacterota bacterium]